MPKFQEKFLFLFFKIVRSRKNTYIYFLIYPKLFNSHKSYNSKYFACKIC